MSLPSGFWGQASYHCPEEFDYLAFDAELRIGVVSLTYEKDPVKRAPAAFRYQELGDGRVLLQLKRSEKWTERVIISREICCGGETGRKENTSVGARWLVKTCRIGGPGCM